MSEEKRKGEEKMEKKTGMIKSLRQTTISLPYKGRKQKVSCLALLIFACVFCTLCGITYRIASPDSSQIGSPSKPTQISEPTTQPEPTARPEPTAQPEPTNIPPTSRPTQEPMTIETDKGTLTVPGNAFMDGRDLEAADPVTVITINIWDKPQRSQVVCTLAHGTEVELLEAEKPTGESRYYIKVKSGTCEGWVSEPFVGSEYHEPIGDQL